MTGQSSPNRAYGTNGLNQLTSAGATALSYDGRGNLTLSGSSTYSYTSENRLATGPGGVTLYYDPTGRLSRLTQGAATTRFEYLGPRLVIERDGAGTVLRRYVPGPGVDEPVVWYEGAGTASRRWLHADERGSVIAISDGTGAMLSINRYDEYGIPASGNAGRFGYTGQAWLPELGLYHYKAWMYSPTLGRFMQTDPIGYGDGMNWYNYVGSDPVNYRDPSGLAVVCNDGTFIPDGGVGDCTDHGGVYEVVAGAKTPKDMGGEYWVGFWASNEDPLALPKLDIPDMPLPSFAKSCSGGGGNGAGDASSMSDYLTADNIGLAGDVITGIGLLTANPALAAAGKLISLGADAYSLKQAYSSGDADQFRNKSMSMGAGLLPGSKLGKLPARLDWGRAANGRYVKNWANKQKLQKFIAGKAKENAANLAINDDC